MSINIDHPNDDISTSAGDAPTLGGGSPSVNVMSTAAATATQYAKLATFSFPATNNVAANLNFVLTPKSTSGSYQPVIVSATALQATTGLSTSSKINVLSTDGLSVSHNDLFLVTSAATNGTDIELHMQSIIAAVYDVQLLSHALDTGISLAWNDGATWSATDPTAAAAVSVTSDFAGSGLITSTATTNSTGTVKYEKLSNGWCNVNFEFTVLADTTTGTVYFTMPVGFRHGITGFSIEERFSGTITGGSAGRLVMAASGAVTINSYAASTGTWRASFGYMARA